MPDDPLVWVVAILAGGVVIVVALALGGVVDVGLNPPRLSFRRKQPPARERVSVLESAEIEEAEVGNISGVTREAGSGAEAAGEREIDVARKAKIKGGKLADISGVRITTPKPGAPDEG